MKYLINIALVILSLVITFISSEIIFRYISSGNNLIKTTSLNIYTNDKRLGFKLRPNVEKYIYWHDQYVRVKINDNSRRVSYNMDYSELCGRSIIAIFGDSYVFGNEENFENTFPYLLRKMVDRDVLNMGVGAYSTWQEVWYLENFLESLPHPAKKNLAVIICFFVGNDYTDNIKKIGAIADHEGRLLSADNANREPDHPSFLRKIISTSYLLSNAYVAIRAASEENFFKNILKGENINPIFKKSFYTEALKENTRSALELLAKVCKTNEIRCHVVIIPDKEQVYGKFTDEATRFRPSSIACELTKEVGLPVTDLLPFYLKALKTETPLYHMVALGHLSKSGHKITAEVLANINLQMEP